MREKFENILKERGIYGENPEDIIYAVHDMLVLVADETKEKEPYATITICDLEKAAYMVFDLVSEME